MRTLIFCTSYVAADAQFVWTARYRRWLNAIRSSGVWHDQILVVDDGSPIAPGWDDCATVEEPDQIKADSPTIMYRFRERLGRHGLTDYPGWYRSFGFAVTYARSRGFEKIVHIESDAFLISDRAVRYFNSANEGWISMWSPTHGCPESGLQIVCRDELNNCCEFFLQPYSCYRGKAIENLIPFTAVEKSLHGDRHRETVDYVPSDADWTMQGVEAAPPGYFWWFKEQTANKEGDRVTDPMISEPSAADGHQGVDYRDFLEFLGRTLVPRTYLEIGTENGSSLSRMPCDAICVDPRFSIAYDVFVRRNRLFFFQMTSDSFFLNNDPRQYFPFGVDISFQDGLHLFESLLEDFINTERSCRRESLIVLHDCLPPGHAMASRNREDADEPDGRYSGFWTGDVWKIIPILKKYRPDIDVCLVDCPPTGLVLCSNLDPSDRTLLENRAAILGEFARMSLSDFGLERLWTTYPMINSRAAITDVGWISRRFGLYPSVRADRYPPD